MQWVRGIEAVLRNEDEPRARSVVAGLLRFTGSPVTMIGESEEVDDSFGMTREVIRIEMHALEAYQSTPRP